MIATADKQRLAEQYKDILRVINLFGDGVMLQDQLQQILILTGRYNRKASVIDALKKLEEHEIIKKVTPKQYRSQFILLKKFGIMFLKGKENTQQVSALKQISNEKYDRMVLRAEIFIQSYLINKNRSLDEVLSVIERNKGSILFNKEQALEYVQMHSNSFMNNKEYQHQLELLKAAREQSKANLDQSKNKEDKEVPVISDVSLFAKIFRKGLIILGVNEKGVAYGYTGSTSIKAIAEAFTLAKEVNKKVFGVEPILINIYSSEGIAITLNDKIKNTHYNTRTREMSKYTPFQQELIKQGMSTSIAVDVNQKQIRAIAIDTNKYRTDI